MAHDVFISYSSQDKPTADAACAVLEQQGIRCWIAPRDIVPGQRWGAAIVGAINSARLMVLVFSGHANASPQVEREVERAVNRGIPLIPVRIENIVPSESLEFFLGTPHWLDAITPPLERHLQYLAQVVRHLLPMPPTDASNVVPPGDIAAVPSADVAPARTDPEPFQRPSLEVVGNAGDRNGIPSGADPIAAAGGHPGPDAGVVDQPPAAHAETNPWVASPPSPLGQPTSDAGRPAAELTVAKPRPWRRSFARYMDYLALLALILGVMAIFAPDWPSGWDMMDKNAGKVGLALLCIFIPLEAVMLSLLGTTPGKWVYGISIRPDAIDARTLRFPAALYRSVQVWIFGMGLGLPIIGLITAFSSFRRLGREGTTLWDRNAACCVRYRAMTWQRWVWIGLAWAGILGGFGAVGVAVSPETDVSRGLDAYNRKDYARAMTLWHRAADHGEAVAQYDIGLLYHYGLGVGRDYEQALTWYRKAADHDNASAQNNIGVLYHGGLGVMRDYGEAAQWYLKAAGQGNTTAQYNLGAAYAGGEGVPKDLAQARQWMQKAAVAGDASAKEWLAGNQADAAPTSAPPPKAIDAGAAYDRGVAAYKAKNYPQALQEFRVAAEAGNASAQDYVGYIYDQGLGVAQDYVQAMDWYRKAADQGNPAAQLNVASLYEDGRGVTRDYGQAMSWYRKAADQGNATAQNNIGALYENGQGVTRDYGQAMSWYRKAADQGNGAAQYNVGRLYADGSGVPKDLAQARVWMQKAADNGDKEAKQWLQSK